MVIFWCQFFNGFSAQVPLDPTIMTIFSVLFNSVPPVVYGAYEQDARQALLLQLPELYSQGRLSKVRVHEILNK